MENKIIQLLPPKLEDTNIKEKITCIRGHRERIFQTYMQVINNKIVFHNYGQGGAGWTFLFGCVNESIRQFEEFIQTKIDFLNKPITIIGAGCYGLLTAITLAHKGYSVQIIAKDTDNIPSNKAAGFFFPRSRKCSTSEEKTIFLNRGIESYKTYQQIIEGTHPFINSGPKVLPAYFGVDIDPGFAPYIEQGLVKKPNNVTINFIGTNKTYSAIEYKIIFINSIIIMQELQREVQNLNIKIVKKEIQSFDEIENQIIFNCTGFGAKELVDDKRIVPVQGHLITLQNQNDIQQLQYMINFKVIQTNTNGKKRDELIYYAPRESGILGVTFLRGQSSLTANQHEFDRLLQRSRDFFGN